MDNMGGKKKKHHLDIFYADYSAPDSLKTGVK